jgi:hypothetical protein
MVETALALLVIELNSFFLYEARRKSVSQDDRPWHFRYGLRVAAVYGRTPCASKVVRALPD